MEASKASGLIASTMDPGMDQDTVWADDDVSSSTMCLQNSSHYLTSNVSLQEPEQAPEGPA